MGGSAGRAYRPPRGSCGPAWAKEATACERGAPPWPPAWLPRPSRWRSRAAQAAPLLAATTRVGPTTPARLADPRPERRRPLGAGRHDAGSSVQRIDRQGNTTRRRRSSLPDLNVGLTDDGGRLISLAVDSWRRRHRHPDQPGQRHRQLRHRRQRSAPATGRCRARSRSAATGGRSPSARSTPRAAGQVVAVANTSAPASVVRVDRRAPRRRDAPRGVALDQQRRPLRRLRLVDASLRLHRRPRLWRRVAPRHRRPTRASLISGRRGRRDLDRSRQPAPAERHRSVRHLRLRRRRPRAGAVQPGRPRLRA